MNYEAPPPKEVHLEETKARIAEDLKLDERFPNYSEEVKLNFIEEIAKHQCNLEQILDIPYPGMEIKENLAGTSIMTVRYGVEEESGQWRDPYLAIKESFISAFLEAAENREKNPYQYYYHQYRLAAATGHECYHLRQAEKWPHVVLDDKVQTIADSTHYLRSRIERGARIFELHYLSIQAADNFNSWLAKGVHYTERGFNHVKISFMRKCLEETERNEIREDESSKEESEQNSN
ncbi:hypothetical protein JXA34_01190 [Patescibacteria group bacterium]|nr:hypothetical protein [Patescibacteria group bacterium]